MSKRVTLADDAYEILDRLRAPGESLPDVVRRWGEVMRKRALLDALGSWKITEKEGKRIADEIYANRRAGKAATQTSTRRLDTSRRR